jgi:predicted enzyme related to lactoylglutathione lyase
MNMPYVKKLISYIAVFIMVMNIVKVTEVAAEPANKNMDREIPKLSAIILRSEEPETQKNYYIDVLGMKERNDGTVGYGSQEAGLVFEKAEGKYVALKSDVYWKIAISVPNIELAYRQLTAKGIRMKVPYQFQDIGYLAHIKDPQGFTIELIEHQFKGDRPKNNWDESLLGGGPSINLLTLRTNGIEPIDGLVKKLGMTPLSIQKVHNYDFTLYFYAFTNEKPPSGNLHDLVNRPWLYKRAYTILEVVHYTGGKIKPLQEQLGVGYYSTRISGLSDNLNSNELNLVNYP